MIQQAHDRSSTRTPERPPSRPARRLVTTTLGTAWVEEPFEDLYLVFDGSDAKTPFASIVGFAPGDGLSTFYSWATPRRSAISSSLKGALGAIAGTYPGYRRDARRRPRSGRFLNRSDGPVA